MHTDPGRCRTDVGKCRTDVEKCTHQCDETQGNNSTQALLTKLFFFGCKKRDTTKEEGSKQEDRQEGADLKKLLEKSAHRCLCM